MKSFDACSGVPCKGAANSSYLSFLNGATNFPLPKCWSFSDKCPLIQIYQDYDSEHHNISRPPSSPVHVSLPVVAEYFSENLNPNAMSGDFENSEAASVRTEDPIPQDIGIFYFEVEILDKGKEGFIAVGLSTSDVSLTRLPGRNS